MSEKIFIKKIDKPKDAVRINSEENIPEFLKDTIKLIRSEADIPADVPNDRYTVTDKAAKKEIEYPGLRDQIIAELAKGNPQILCMSNEGYNRSPLGTVIGFDRSAPKSPTGKGAWPLGPDAYRELEPDVFWNALDLRTAELVTGPMSIETKYGIEVLEEGSIGFLTTRPNGSQNILGIGTSSLDAYEVCTKDGDPICLLNEYTQEMLISGTGTQDQNKDLQKGIGINDD